MNVIVKPTTVEELKGIWLELLLNNTDNVTKIAPLSTLNGIAYGTAKVGQRVLKDLALIETHIFPDLAFGQYLDKVAENNGIAPRFSASASSGYVRLVGTAGTTYVAGTQKFIGNHGIQFDLSANYTIPADGFGYALIQSTTTGESTNVNPLTINRVSPIPSGHSYCINEYVMSGGRDAESDDDFRKRIKQGANVLARGTISMLEQAFNKINSNVYRCFFNGINSNGQNTISILTQNGADLTTNELATLLIKGKQFFSLTDLKPDNVNGYGIQLKNITWTNVDVSVRLTLNDNVSPDDVRKEIQIRLNKYFDYRYFDNDKVEWDDLLGVVKSVPGVKYVLDNYFSPSVDSDIPKNTIPRMRGFIMLNPDGSLILNNAGTLNPIYYPSMPDFNYQSTVFKNL